MKTLSLESVQTPQDLFQTVSGWVRSTRRRQILLWGHRLFGLLLLILAVLESRREGLTFHVMLGLFIAISVASPGMWATLLFSLFLFWTRPTMTVTLDENGISMQVASQQKQIPWSSFQTTGKAWESETHFFLESFRGSVLVPKRAFPSESAQEEFRTLLTDKLGDRCHWAAEPATMNG